MKQQIIPYCHVISFGFKRHQMNDSTHEKQHGYDDFYVQLKIKKNIYAEWDRHTRTIEVWKQDRDGTIIARIQIENLIQLEKLMAFLNPKKYEVKGEVIL